jgi:hypothetical protein
MSERVRRADKKMEKLKTDDDDWEDADDQMVDEDERRQNSIGNKIMKKRHSLSRSRS